MATISGLDLKREIIATKLKSEELPALLSGFVRSCMALEVTQKDGVMLVLDCQTDFVREYIAAKMLAVYKIAPKSKDGALIYADCEKLLRALDITRAGGGIFEITDIPECYKNYASAYVRGMFLGCGSFSAHEVTKTTQGRTSGGGYHCEFSVLSESLADELIKLLGEHEVTARKMARAEKYVVYVKNVENVSNCLALMRADKMVLKVTNTYVEMIHKRDVNRRVNAELANMSRSADASVEVTEAIEYIDGTVGLSALPPKLVEAADARVNSPGTSISELAYELGISKSGLKHRFDRIIAIANKLRDERGDK